TVDANELHGANFSVSVVGLVDKAGDIHAAGEGNSLVSSELSINTLSNSDHFVVENDAPKASSFQDTTILDQAGKSIVSLAGITVTDSDAEIAVVGTDGHTRLSGLVTDTNGHHPTVGGQSLYWAYDRDGTAYAQTDSSGIHDGTHSGTVAFKVDPSIENGVVKYATTIVTALDPVVANFSSGSQTAHGNYAASATPLTLSDAASGLTVTAEGYTGGTQTTGSYTDVYSRGTETSVNPDTQGIGVHNSFINHDDHDMLAMTFNKDVQSASFTLDHLQEGNQAQWTAYAANGTTIVATGRIVVSDDHWTEYDGTGHVIATGARSGNGSNSAADIHITVSSPDGKSFHSVQFTDPSSNEHNNDGFRVVLNSATVDSPSTIALGITATDDGYGRVSQALNISFTEPASGGENTEYDLKTWGDLHLESSRDDHNFSNHIESLDTSKGEHLSFAHLDGLGSGDSIYDTIYIGENYKSHSDITIGHGEHQYNVATIDNNRGSDGKYSDVTAQDLVHNQNVHGAGWVDQVEINCSNAGVAVSDATSHAAPGEGSWVYTVHNGTAHLDSDNHTLNITADAGKIASVDIQTGDGQIHKIDHVDKITWHS
ncbi:hypothetical protein, partial [Polynucleobacter sp. MWH-Braz-FAM2G]|uniref:hypothetical protein n=1 Tax=Polynucleobacter sp. MWH-Braz-FAM2G TaxID=1855883 RepID=UPI001BFED562